jgi:hypothetical protein
MIYEVDFLRHIRGRALYALCLIVRQRIREEFCKQFLMSDVHGGEEVTGQVE